MNLRVLLIFFGLMVLKTSLFAEGDGFGENPGGAGGDTVFVDNTDDLKHYAGLTEPYVIFVMGTIDVGSDLRLASFKTLSGLDSNSTILGNINIKAGTNNVVVKNLNITNPANDGITIRNAKYIFITNCTVYDCADGCIDITVESDFVTVSYCRFYYQNVTFHKFVNLIGADDADVTDRGKLHVTMHHNWWDTGCTSRMPRVRYGRVHVYNNYFSCVENNYCTRSAIEAEVLSERNFYEGVRDPVTTEGGKLRSLDNMYVNCEGTIYPGMDEVFIPSYSYTSQGADEAKEEVKQFAGNKFRSTSVNLKKETKINWANPSPIIFGSPLTEVQLNATAEGNTSSPVYSHPSGSILPGGYQTITVTFPEDTQHNQASKTVVIKVEFEFYALNIQTVGTSDTSLIQISPAWSLTGNRLEFKKDTEVKLTALSNLVSKFEMWGNGSAEDTLLVLMDNDQLVSAHYVSLDFIAAWDFVVDGNKDRISDLYASSENQNALFQLTNEGGTSLNFALFSGENKLQGKNAAMIRRGSSSAGTVYFQIAFDASQYQDIRVNAHMLGMNTYYKTQKVEYSVDGINFSEVGELILEQDSVWYSSSVKLPEDANGKPMVVVRYKADKSSILTTNGTIGTSISEIVVLANDVSTFVADVEKEELKPVKTMYFTVGGKLLPQPVWGINIVLYIYENGSRKAKQVYYLGE